MEKAKGAGFRVPTARLTTGEPLVVTPMAVIKPPGEDPIREPIMQRLARARETIIAKVIDFYKDNPTTGLAPDFYALCSNGMEVRMAPAFDDDAGTAKDLMALRVIFRELGVVGYVFTAEGRGSFGAEPERREVLKITATDGLNEDVLLFEIARGPDGGVRGLTPLAALRGQDINDDIPNLLNPQA